MIFFLVLAAVLSALGIWLADQTGTVMVSWPEVIGPDRPIPVGIAVVLIAVIALAVVIVFELLRVIVSAPKKIATARGHGKELHGYQEVSSGLMAVAAGDLSAARLHNRNAEKLLERNAASLLLAAQTAQLEGKEDVAQIKFKQMRESDEGELLGLRGLLAQAIKSGNDEEAL
ncbi:MAG: heme biosynthesis HemY N-terminal domain-containing protein, partial [Pseudomonadota bacterium]